MRRLLPILVLFACNKGENADRDAPTYYADVRPIVDNNCARCHTDGGIAPSFDQAEDFVARASLVQAYTQAGIMPPPAPDPTCADYEHSAMYVLAEADKQTLSDWVDGGAQLGDPAEAPPPRESMTIGPFDQELIPAAPYTPQFDGGGNDYRCWAFDVGNTDDLYLTGLEALVDQTLEVHHVVLYLDTRKSGDVTDADGYSCGGFGEPGYDYLHGWGPGAPSLQFDEGMGVKLAAGARLVVQAHYYDTGTPLPDATGYGLLTADQVDTEVQVLPYGVDSFTIPAGAEDHEETASDLWPSTYPDFVVLGVWPHMHLFGSGFDFKIRHPDDSETCLVRMPGYDFHNQVATMFLEPITLSAGDTIELTCRYDNSAGNPNQPNDPPEDVRWGEGTEDEMCFGFTYGYVDF